MKKTFSIGEISELLNIPKSTLRYWEGVGLVDLPRDDINNYRTYNTGAVYTISDLAHYRRLRMALQDMKKLPKLSPGELAETLENLDQNLEQQLKELHTAKAFINRKMHCINEYKRLISNQYQEELPDYDSIYSFSVDDTQAWSVYIKDQYQSILLYDIQQNRIEAGLLVPTSEQPQKIWSRNDQAMYLTFILKVSYSDPSPQDFLPHVDYLKASGYHTDKIFARYLFSACDEKYYDYYQAYAELKEEK